MKQFNALIDALERLAELKGYYAARNQVIEAELTQRRIIQTRELLLEQIRIELQNAQHQGYASGMQPDGKEL